MTYVYCMFMRSSIRSVPPNTSSGCVYCVQDKPVHRSHIVGGCMNTNHVFSRDHRYDGTPNANASAYSSGRGHPPSRRRSLIWALLALACIVLPSAGMIAQQSGGATKINDAWCKCDGEIRLWMDGCGIGGKYMFVKGDALKDKFADLIVLDEGTRTQGQSAYRSYNVTGLCPGTYTYSMLLSYSVTPNGPLWGVVKVETVVIGGPEKYLEATADVTNGNCVGDGYAIINATGGNGGNSYLLEYWNETTGRWEEAEGDNQGKQNGAVATKLRNNKYRVKVTDSKNCFIYVEFTVSGQGGPVNFNVDVQDPPCSGGGTGSASVTGVTGTTDYVISWSHTATGAASVTDLAPGTYEVTVTDRRSGCKSTKTFVVKQRKAVEAKAIVRQSGCDGNQNSGRIEIVDVVANGRVTYTWTPAISSGPVADDLAPGTYTVRITDSEGCSWEQTIVIREVPPVDLSLLTKSFRDGLGRCRGRATAVIASGTAPFSYSWLSPSGCTGISCEGNAPGTYTLEVTDANGCRAVQTVVIECTASRIVSVNPNPVESSAMVAFDLESPGIIGFKIYDTGFNIAKGIDAGVQGPGLIMHHIDMSDLPSGVYYLNLVFNGQEEQEVVMIVKR